MTIEVTLSRPPASTTFEVGSFAEAVAILSENESALIQLFTLADKLGGGAGDEAGGEEQAATAEAPKTRKPRTPKAEAVAPAPLPVPSAAPAPPAPPPNLAPAVDGGIPPFLQRDAAVTPAPPAATAAPPAPPPLPNAPPIAPAPPNTLATKVVAELERRAKGSADGGKALADWLAAYGVTQPNKSYGEALSAVALATDVQLGPVAAQLGVA
jgi:hypothetical protein